MAKYQDGFFVRDRDKRNRFYIDNELFDYGYAALFNDLLLVYSHLSKYANAVTQTCFPSLARIQKETGITNRRTLLGIINVLLYLKLIAVRRKDKTRSNVYYLIHHSQWRKLDGGTLATARSVAKMPRKQYQKRYASGGTSATLNQISKSDKEIRKEDVDKLKRGRAALIAKFKIGSDEV